MKTRTTKILLAIMTVFVMFLAAYFSLNLLNIHIIPKERTQLANQIATNYSNCWEGVWPRVTSETALTNLAVTDPFSNLTICNGEICWNKIQVGVTTFAEAGEILKSKVSNLETDELLYRWYEITCEPPHAIPGKSENFVYSGQNGLIEAINIKISPVTFRQVVDHFGTPDYYFVHLSDNPDNLQKAIGLVYQRHGIIFLTPFEDNSNQLIKPENFMVAFRLWLMQDRSIENLRRDKNYIFYSWDGLE